MVLFSFRLVSSLIVGGDHRTFGRESQVTNKGKR